MTVREMSPTCKRYADHLEAEETKKEQMRRMTMGDAYAIFANIDTVEFDDEVKGLAVHKIAELPTHNGVTKDMMVKVIRWLLGLAFDFYEENAE